MKQKTALLIDADIVSYRAAAASETRTVEVLHKSSGRTKIFPTRTAFKSFLKDQNFEYVPEDYEFKDIQTPEDISHPLHTIKIQIKKIQEAVPADVYRIFIGGKGNFRLDLPYPTQYKAQRADMLRPLHLSECRDFCVRQLGAELIESCEADDALSYVGYAYKKQGYDVVLATIDKDCHSHSGLYKFDFTKEGEKPFLIPDFGELYLDSKGKVKGWGDMWLWQQILNGDSTDGLNPTEVAGVKFGEKSAYKVLKDCKNNQEALNAVYGMYKKWYSHCPTYTDWSGKEQVASPEFMFQLYFKGVKMMETPDDKLCMYEFFDRKGITLQ